MDANCGLNGCRSYLLLKYNKCVCMRYNLNHYIALRNPSLTLQANQHDALNYYILSLAYKYYIRLFYERLDVT